MKISEQIQQRLEQAGDGYSDLIALYLQHLGDLELQVLGDKPFRIPKTTADGLGFTDSHYNLGQIKEIGSSGWLWESQVSLWVGFDVDAIVGHAPGVGISDAELDKVREAACGLPYVQVRRSTSGSGLHLYVYCTNISSKTRAEHAAVARCILSQMSADCNFDFHQRVDVGGAILWGCSDRATAENQGLTLVKQAERAFDVSELPTNWRDQVAVVTGQRTPGAAAGISADDEQAFEELAGSNSRVELTPDHKQLIDWIGSRGTWNREYHLLQTHTILLKQAHQELGLAGTFDTNSPGSNLDQANCFAFPIEGGAWRIVRFGRRTQETTGWQTSEAGWTWTLFNTQATFAQACEAQGATRIQTNEYWFPRLDHVPLAFKVLNLVVPNGTPDAQAWAAWDPRTGQVTVRFTDQVRGRRGEQHPAHPGWFWQTGKWVAQVGVVADVAENTALEMEDRVRRIRDMSGHPCGWTVKDKSDSWVYESDHSVKNYLKAEGLDGTTADSVMGTLVQDSWTLVTIPFEREYPGDRRWNRNAPQLALRPAEEPGEHPHWDTLLSHAGEYLDDFLADGLTPFASGREYLAAWIASVIQQPFDPLPYLFFFGTENTGKSSFHDAIDLLIKPGVVRADRALTQDVFNGELENAVVCVVEETNLGTNKKAASRLKDFVTSRQLSIRRMRRDSIMMPNTTHWIQCSNELDACPITAADTRVTAIQVNPLHAEIPRAVLFGRLKEEAPQFLRTLLDTRLPPHQGRLRIPIIQTNLKSQITRAAEEDPVAEFLKLFTESDPTSSVRFADFYKAFQQFLPTSTTVGKQKVSQSLRNVGVRVERTPVGDTLIRELKLKGGLQ